MTNRERVYAALRFEKPDYVPHSIDFTQQMLDKMLVYTQNPGYLSTINNHFSVTHLCKPQVELQPDYFMDEYGVVWNKSGVDKDIGVVDKYLLQDPADLANYSLPPVDEAFIRQKMEHLMQTAGDNFRVANIGFSLFERAWTLRGMENLLCDMIEEPEFVHDLLGRITQRNLQILDIALEYDIDCFQFGDDWGQQRGLIMGPALWRAFIKPYLTQMYSKIRSAGKWVAQHSCGDIREVMDDLVEIGLDMYQTFQPEIYGYEYAEKLYGKITIWGGISTQRELPMKSPEEICQITKNLLSYFPHGGLVAAPTHAIPGDVPPENVEAMLSVLMHQA